MLNPMKRKKDGVAPEYYFNVSHIFNVWNIHIICVNIYLFPRKLLFFQLHLRLLKLASSGLRSRCDKLFGRTSNTELMKKNLIKYIL